MSQEQEPSPVDARQRLNLLRTGLYVVERPSLGRLAADLLVAAGWEVREHQGKSYAVPETPPKQPDAVARHLVALYLMYEQQGRLQELNMALDHASVEGEVTPLEQHLMVRTEDMYQHYEQARAVIHD